MNTATIGILNTASTYRTTAMEAKSDHAAVTAGRMTRDNKFPTMLKVLSSASVVQGILLVVSATTLGIYVNENVSLMDHILLEPCCVKTGFLHMRKQRRRSVAQ